MIRSIPKINFFSSSSVVVLIVVVTGSVLVAVIDGLDLTVVVSSSVVISSGGCKLGLTVDSNVEAGSAETVVVVGFVSSRIPSKLAFIT